MSKDKILHIISEVIYTNDGKEMNYIDIDNMMEAYGDITNGEWIYCKDFINAIQELIKQNDQKEKIIKNALLYLKTMEETEDTYELEKILKGE